MSLNNLLRQTDIKHENQNDLTLLILSFGRRRKKKIGGRDKYNKSIVLVTD